MRRFAVLLLLAAAAALLPASKADAYKLFKHRWYSKTLTYYDATGGRYKDEIRAAASVLNRSGARIKVRSASRRKAHVRISVSSNLRPAGQARYFVDGGIVRNARILLRPDLEKNWPTPAAAQMGTIAVVAHEMAHVLGLDHENRRCATMNSVLWSSCNLPSARLAVPLPDPRARRRARPRPPLRRAREERRAGAVRGRAGAGAAARAAARRHGVNGGVTVSLDRGRGAARPHRGPAQGGRLPDRHRGHDGDAGREARFRPRAGEVDPGPAAGAGQLLLRGRGHRPARTARAPSARPRSSMWPARPRTSTAAWADAQRTQLRLTDTSTDPDGQIIAWRWDFGDGTRRRRAIRR